MNLGVTINTAVSAFCGSEGMAYGAAVFLAAAAVVTVCAGYQRLGAEKVTEPLEIPWDDAPRARTEGPSQLEEG